jgi:hypothetical protein
MRIFAEKPKTTQQTTSAKSTLAGRTHFGQSHEVDTILHLQRTIGNQAVQRLLEANTRDVKGESGTTGIVRFGHDFSRIPVHATTPIAVQHDGSTAPAGKAGDSPFTFDDRCINSDKLNSDARLNNAFHNNSLLTSAYKGRLDSSPTSSFPSARSDVQLAAGDQPGEAEDVALSGEPGSSEVAAQPESEVLGGDATSIKTSDLSAAEWKNNGALKWWIKWVTDGTSGWIVQKVDSTYSGTRADGTAITNASVGLTPSYYEAWEVASNGTITGSLGATGNRDRWERPNLGALGSQTSLSVKGTVYWTSKDPASSGFTSGGVANAGSLLSSTSAPAGIGSALLVRSAYGTWVSSGAPALPGCFTS